MRNLSITTILVSALLLTSGCQTTSTATTAPGGPAGVSRASYSPFSDQADHLAELLKAGNFDDANRLVTEQDAFFKTAAPEAQALMAQLAGHFSARLAPELEGALPALKAAPAPRDVTAWRSLRQSVTRANAALASHDAIAVFKYPAFAMAQAAQVRAERDRIRAQFIPAAAEAWLAYPADKPFFEDYPFIVEAEDLMAADPGLLDRKLAGLDAQGLLGFADAHPRDLMGDAAWDRIGQRYVQARMNRGQTGIREMLAVATDAQRYGFKTDAVKDVGVVFSQVTSPTLLKGGHIDFALEVEQDLPFPLDTKGLDDALDSDAKLLIVFNIALAKASRKVRNLKHFDSTYLAGYSREPNPDWEMAKMNMMMAGSGTGQANANMMTFGGFGSIIGAMAASSNYEDAQNRMASTPQFIDIPVYQGYTFDEAQVEAKKVMTVNYYVIDKTRNTFYRSTFDVVENHDFRIAYRLHKNDENSEQHLSTRHSEKDVTDWEEAPATIKLSSLVDHYLANEKRAKPLASVTEVRKQIIQDRNVAVTAYRDKKPDEVMQDDPRFDSVVAIYQGGGGMGSGFYIGPDLVLTNWHVVEGSRFVEMKNKQKRETFGKVLVKDVRLDLAVVQVQDRGKPVRFYDRATLKLGDQAEVIGHPKRYLFSITRGVISAIRDLPSINIPGGGGKDVRYIQTDAPINGGNSGGPLFLDDKVIGVNTWKRIDQGVDGLNFSVHIDEVKTFLRENLPDYEITALRD
ncbi:MAG: serine protease [Alphaproteobacteria bacterium]|nr:serine protease [Alphaproteobacteria bacterium]